MNVRIDRDREGWYWYARKDEDSQKPLSDDERSRVRGNTYDEISNLARAAGHEIDNAGWKYKLLSWNWHSIGFDRYPGWEIEHGAPPWCRLEHVNRSDAWPGTKSASDRVGTKSSDEVTNAWDDIAQEQFYTRDFSLDGSVSVGNGEAYGSLWWFRTAAERDRFLTWVAEYAPGVKVVYRSAVELPERSAG